MNPQAIAEFSIGGVLLIASLVGLCTVPKDVRLGLTIPAVIGAAFVAFGIITLQGG
jgi:hypothetical protein